MASVKKTSLDNDGLAKAAGVMTVYNFDSVSGVFTFASEEFFSEGVGLPAFSTGTVPPAAEEDKVCVYRDGACQQIADHRG